MTDILQIGLSALLAQQRALAVTSNNVANASTPGYSRQRVELAERPGQQLGNGYQGAGVQVADVRRLGDDILAAQLRSAKTSFQRADAFAGLAGQVDDLLGNDQTGLAPSLQSFSNALQDVAADPASSAARSAYLGEARNLAARLGSLAAQLGQIDGESRSRLGAAATEVTQIGASLADVNRQIVASGSNGAPADLLDQRDKLLGRLAELVKVDTTTAADGSVNVFIGSGQALVVGTAHAELDAVTSPTDPSQPELVLRGGGVDADVTKRLGGGEIGAMLDFRREVLAPTAAAVGRIAVGVAAAVNAGQRRGMDLNGALGADLFSVPAPAVYAATTNAGSGAASAAVTDVGALQPTSYRLRFDGSSYTLTREDSGAVVPLSGSGTAADPFVADGLGIVVGGAPAAGDEFAIDALGGAAGGFRVLISDPGKIAAAAPIKTTPGAGNTGDAVASAGEVVDATDPNLLATTTITFLDPATYSIDGSGAYAYTSGTDILVNGARFSITGNPAAGDRFVLAANTGGVGDNRNALATAAALGGGLLDGGATSMQSAVGQLVGDVGSRSAESQNARDAASGVLDQTRQRLDSVSGVNLDEEAANMLQAQQMYQAAAQMITVADTTFNSLLAALRG